MRSRKRTLRALSEDDDDELSSPVKTIDASPLSAAKKRKLNTPGTRSSPSRSAAGGSARGVLGKSGNTTLGYGKENKVADEEVNNEEGDAEVEDAFEQGDDEDTMNVEVPEVQDTGKRRSRGGERRLMLDEMADGLGSTKDDEPTQGVEDIYDVAASSPENGNAIAKAKSATKSTPKPVEPADGIKRNKDGSIAKRRGRPPKNPDAAPAPKKPAPKPKSKAKQSDDSQKWDLLKKAKALSSAAIRDRLIELGETEDAEEYTKEYTTWLNNAVVEDTPQDDPVPATTPRKRGRPRKSAEAPKGILTPMKDRVLKSKKSVTFDGRNELDLGFRDLPDSAKLSKWKELQEEEDSDSSDEVACAICSGIESEQPNEILFCDKCDLAVHQACYNMPIIPEGDWLCRDCSSDAPPEMELEEVEIVDLPSDLPDIEGFDRHLRSIQRVVLDKLSGQKHIKLRGHDEQMQKVYQVVEQTVLAGEGNSMLVIGARGTGKTTVSFYSEPKDHN